MATMDNLRRLECAWDPRRCGEGSFSAVYRGGTKSQGLATHREARRPGQKQSAWGRGGGRQEGTGVRARVSARACGVCTPVCTCIRARPRVPALSTPQTPHRGLRGASPCRWGPCCCFSSEETKAASAYGEQNPGWPGLGGQSAQPVPVGLMLESHAHPAGRGWPALGPVRRVAAWHAHRRPTPPRLGLAAAPQCVMVVMWVEMA